jgi:flagellum-specific ATP synthase
MRRDSYLFFASPRKAAGLSDGMIDMAQSIDQQRIRRAAQSCAGVRTAGFFGHVKEINGVSLQISGIAPWLQLGSRLCVHSRVGEIQAEVVAISLDSVAALALGSLEGVGAGDRVVVAERQGLAVSDTWLGRLIDPLGNPLDSGGLLPMGASVAARRLPPPAGERARLGPRLDLGVRALDAFTTCRQGQRLGLFAASGVGKSTLLSMLARGADCDVCVVALVGERGRELREFIEDDLGAEGMARSVVVCATSDTAPLVRREAGYAAMTVAEYFADQGLHVLLMMDSVTRFAQALREIGLAAGEPPTARGYPPSVFAELPRLLERAGPRRQGSAGHITGLFTVLVDGDDHDEPVSDAVRGILDGHVVLDRRIGEQGRYPAIDVLRSLSRTVPGCLSEREAQLVRRARNLLGVQAEMRDLVRLGGYRKGMDPSVDEALRLAPRIEAMLVQHKSQRSTVASAFAALAESMEEPLDATA